MHKIGPRGPKHYILGDSFFSKNARKLRFYVFLHVNARKHDIIILPEVDQIHKKLWIFSNLVQVHWDPHLEQNSQEEYMESELPGIIQVNVVAKNILLGSLGTQHQAVFAMWCLFLKRNTKFLNQTVTLKCFLVKQYTSLIYVKLKSFCLVTWAFPFVDPWGPFSWVKLRKYFMHMRVKSS